MEDIKPGCVRPQGGVVNEELEKNAEDIEKTEFKKGENNFMVKVGKKAPDFVAPAYFNGKFVNVKLSDYVGKWIVLCFYPGDFTFV